METGLNPVFVSVFHSYYSAAALPISIMRQVDYTLPMTMMMMYKLVDTNFKPHLPCPFCLFFPFFFFLFSRVLPFVLLFSTLSRADFLLSSGVILIIVVIANADNR